MNYSGRRTAMVAAAIVAAAALVPFVRTAQDDTGSMPPALQTLVDDNYADPGFADQDACESYAAGLASASYSDGQINATIAYCATLSYGLAACNYTDLLSGATDNTSCHALCVGIPYGVDCAGDQASCDAECDGIFP